MTYEPGTALEFFAGIGLARMGLERAGWRVVFANDYDPKKKAMHEGHWGPDPTYVLDDVFRLTADQLPSAELAWASFPCIDLSLAGNRAGLRGTSSAAYWGFQDLLVALGPRRPPIVIIENVHGMLSSRGGSDLAQILSGLAQMGYCVDLLAIDAVHFVPQSRPRLFIVGVGAPYTLPRTQPYQSTVRPVGLLDFRLRHADLPWGELPTGPLPNRTARFAEVAERFPSDADIWWSTEQANRLLDQMSTRHRTAVEVLRSGAQESFGTVYRRVRSSGCMAEVRFDGVAGCLRTPRGGSSRQFVIQMGQGEFSARHMTAVEYARLQGAAGFRIRVPFNQALFGFGDAVCVPAVEWLAEQCNTLRSAIREVAVA